VEGLYLVGAVGLPSARAGRTLVTQTLQSRSDCYCLGRVGCAITVTIVVSIALCVFVTASVTLLSSGCPGRSLAVWPRREHRRLLAAP